MLSLLDETAVKDGGEQSAQPHLSRHSFSLYRGSGDFSKTLNPGLGLQGPVALLGERLPGNTPRDSKKTSPYFEASHLQSFLRLPRSNARSSGRSGCASASAPTLPARRRSTVFFQAAWCRSAPVHVAKAASTPGAAWLLGDQVLLTSFSMVLDEYIHKRQESSCPNFPSLSHRKPTGTRKRAEHRQRGESSATSQHGSQALRRQRRSNLQKESHVVLKVRAGSLLRTYCSRGSKALGFGV